MTRRDFLLTASAAATRPSTPARLVIPLHRVTDARARCTKEQSQHFWSVVWPECVRDLSGGAIEIQTGDGPGEVKRTAGDRPIFVGLRRDVLNLVLTDHIPMLWDSARARAGVTVRYDGYDVCMVALRYAHGNQIPFIAVNTCLHELLHALFQDIYVSRPKWYQAGGREWRIDWFATCLWLFHDGAAIRRSARGYLDRLRSISR